MSDNMHTEPHKISFSADADLDLNQVIIRQRDSVTEALQRTIVNLRDRKIHEALIDLGWTPPNADRVCVEAYQLEMIAEGLIGIAGAIERNELEGREDQAYRLRDDILKLLNAHRAAKTKL